MSKDVLSAELARQLLAYDEATGILTWRVTRGNVKSGTVVSCIDTDGYVSVKVHGKSYKAHRVIWLIVHGSFPTLEIDHKDGNRANNALSNLREASPLINMQNQRRAHSRSTSGLLGASFNTRCQKWASQISINGKRTWIGFFPTAEAAHAAYLAVKREHHAGNTL